MVQRIAFGQFLKPNRRPHTLASDEDADLVGMRLYGQGPFHREHKLAAKIRKKTHFVIRAGDVIYNKLFAWKGTFGLVPDDLDGMFVSDKFPTYELDESKIHRDYLKWFFRYSGLWSQAERFSIGSAALSKLTLNPPKFLELEIPAPTLNEQARIAANLGNLFERIKRIERARRESAECASALLLSQLDRIMGGFGEFKFLPLSDCVDPTRGISYGVVQTGQEFDGGVPTLRAGDVRPFHVRMDSVKRVDPNIESKYLRTRLRGREVLLRIRGGLGEVAVCPEAMIGGNVSREVAVIPLLEDFNPLFVMYFIAAPAAQEFLKKHLRGTAYVGINLKDVRRLEIPVLKPEMQKEVVAEIEYFQSRIESLRNMQDSSSRVESALLPSILDKAFGGSL